jgi:hypothetical protein
MICFHDFFFTVFEHFFKKITLFIDEQVALKKKEKEASQKWHNPWKPSDIECEKSQVHDQSKVSMSSPVERSACVFVCVSKSHLYQFLLSFFLSQGLSR